MSDDLTWDLPTRLEEGRTNGSHLRWQVTPIHKEAAATIRQQQETIERLRKLLTTCADAMSPLANCPLSKGRAIVIPGEQCRKEAMSAMLAARTALENTND